jgi:hypothetical protein
MLPAVRQALASFFKRHFHRSHRSAVKAFNNHCRISATWNNSVDEPLRDGDFYEESVKAVLMCRKNFTRQVNMGLRDKRARVAAIKRPRP